MLLGVFQVAFNDNMKNGVSQERDRINFLQIALVIQKFDTLDLYVSRTGGNVTELEFRYSGIGIKPNYFKYFKKIQNLIFVSLNFDNIF